MTTYLGFFLLILCSPSVDCWDVYESSLDFHGLSIRKNDLWSVVTADDMGMCAKTCKLNKDCLSFTYNWITRNCRGHPEIFDRQTGSFDEDLGSQYYYSITYSPTPPTTPIPSTTTTKKGGGPQKAAPGGEQVAQETTSTIGGGQVTQETTTTTVGGQVTLETTTTGGGYVTQETTTTSGGQVTP